MDKDMDKTRCGFVALLGAPNAGKSTLLNALVGEKVSIVTPKAQTTRNRILGIAMAESSQIILIDTPGVFLPKRRLDRAMVHAAWSSPGDADLTCLLVDVSQRDLTPNRGFLEKLNSRGITPILVLNKIDLIPAGRLLEIAHILTTGTQVRETFMLSALRNDGIAQFKSVLAQAVPPSPWLYPEDQTTNVPMRAMAAEITREKLFMALRDELPYALTVTTDLWEEFDNGDVKITQTITIEREGQRKIVLGKDGTLIKSVNQRARRDLTQSLERKVHLFLYVKVRPQWAENPGYYREMGLEFNS